MAPRKIHCMFCGKPMPKSLLMANSKQFTRSTSLAIMDSAGHFDTLRCAARYGMFKAETESGYRAERQSLTK